ncbi:MAG: L-threonylcarbamoyladenylate synthase [Christensenellales bacterium]
METKVKKLTRKFCNECVEVIRSGGLVSFPTETVYGLGADATNNDAVRKIFEVKGRPQDNPLIVHLADRNQIESYAEISNDIERLIIKKCMPGPISLILRKRDNISDVVTCGLTTVAIRIPINKTARKFIRATKLPICAPSANTSKRPSPTRAKDVLADMNGKIPAIIDGGSCKIGVESTVCKVENNMVYILRPGKFSARKLSKILQVPVVDKLNSSQDKVAESPGTKYTHYCPKCEMILIKNDILKNIQSLYDNFTKQGKKAIVLCSKETAKKLDGIEKIILGKTSEDACKNIFKTLRNVENDYDVILAEFIAKGDMQDALFNRMIKSASGKII